MRYYKVEEELFKRIYNDGQRLNLLKNYYKDNEYISDNPAFTQEFNPADLLTGDGKVYLVNDDPMEEQLNLHDELKEHAKITVRGIVKMLPPDVQTIVHNAERLDAEKHWYKWRLEYARELLEKGEVMKAKELLNQTDVDFRCFSELWEKAHQHVR